MHIFFLISTITFHIFRSSNKVNHLPHKSGRKTPYNIAIVMKYKSIFYVFDELPRRFNGNRTIAQLHIDLWCFIVRQFGGRKKTHRKRSQSEWKRWKWMSAAEFGRWERQVRLYFGFFLNRLLNIYENKCNSGHKM